MAQLAGAVEFTDCTSAESPGYDTKQSDDESPMKVEFWGIRSTLSLPLLSGPLWSVVVAPDRVQSVG